MTVQIILGFIALVVVCYSLAFGFALEWIITKGLKQSEPIVFLNGLMVYYFIAEFITRYFIQSLPVLDVQPYLHLPIPRSRIVNFLLGKSMLHVLNFFVFLFFTPFAFTIVSTAYGISQACAWLLSLWLISMASHFTIVLLKKLTPSVWSLIVIIAMCAVLAGSDYFGWYKLSSVSEMLFRSALQGYTIVVVLFFLLTVLYVLIYRLFLNKLYPEELSTRENQAFYSADWSFLQNFGVMGAWIRVEMKLIFRNKRSRELFLLNFFSFFMALILYHFARSQSAYPAFLLYGIIFSGFFIMNYGQFLYSWQGEHFDFMLTRPTSVRLFIESKYWLLITTNVLWFLFSIPFLFIGWHIVLVNLVCTLYNIGINIFLVMNIAMWGVRRIDLKHPGSINLEGMGAAQWVMILPQMLSPFIFYLPFSLMGYPIIGLTSVGVAGLLGLVFRRKLIDITSLRFNKMRYAMASNFRKDQ